MFRDEDSPSITDHDHSFGRDVLCATNSIFSSFQNSRKVKNKRIGIGLLQDVFS